MRMLLALIVVLPILSGLAAGASSANPEWNHRHQLTALESRVEGTVRFIVMPDRTGGERKGVFDKALRAVELLQPEFVITVGDHIEGYTDDESELRRQWEEFFSLVGPLSLPWFCTPGNHDNLNAVQKELWEENFGRPYYYFNYGGFLFLSLNSQDEPGNAEYQTGLGAEQLEYARQVLAENPDALWTFVFVHQPMWWINDSENAGSINPAHRHPVEMYVDNGRWTELESMLSGRQFTVFAGHEHIYSKFVRAGADYYVLATAGGSLPTIAEDLLTFDHVTLVTATPGEKPVVSHLLLDGVAGPDVGTDSASVRRKSLQREVTLPSLNWFFPADRSESRQLRIPLINTTAEVMQYEWAASSPGGLRLINSQANGQLEPGASTEITIQADLMPFAYRENTPYLYLSGNYRFSSEEDGDCVIPWTIRTGYCVGMKDGLTVRASSHDGNVPDNVLDDDLSTRWSAQGDNEWILLALPEERVVQELGIAFLYGSERESYFDVSCSSDLDTWQPAYSGSSSGDTDQLEQFPLQTDGAVRYILITGHGNSANKWNSITEIAL